jgi:hypothetical protein
MKANEPKNIKISFPFSLYFQQLCAPDVYVKYFNPWQFWRRYRIIYLETCWELNLVQYLERCLKLKCQPVFKQQEDLPQTLKYRGLPGKKNPNKVILISPPRVELKYRGVTYHATRITAVDLNQIKSDSNQVEFNIWQQTATNFSSNNHNQTSNNIS